MNHLAPPLCVDLDGTLIATDSLWECFRCVLQRQPQAMPGALLKLFQGKAAFKRRLAEQADLDVTQLPYREQLLEFLRVEHARGRKLVLATGADAIIADGVAKHLGIFDEVICSDGMRNNSGAAKAEALCERFGRKGFDYIGNSRTDLPIWREAKAAMVVGKDEKSIAHLKTGPPVERIFHDHKP